MSARRWNAPLVLLLSSLAAALATTVIEARPAAADEAQSAPLPAQTRDRSHEVGGRPVRSSMSVYLRPRTPGSGNRRRALETLPRLKSQVVRGKAGKKSPPICQKKTPR